MEVLGMNDLQTRPETIKQVERLEVAIRKSLPLVELKVTHHFSKGLYARELFIPAGTVLTGEVHKFENLNIMSQGDLSVMTEDGIKRVQAPFTIVSPPGTKRAAYAHADTVWTTIHATQETDVEKIKQEVVCSSYDDYLSYCEQLKLESKEST
jgi:hypothetical protein